MTRKEFLKAAVASSALGSIGRSSVSATQAVKAKNFPAGTTRAVIDFMSNASFDRVPTRVVDEAKRCLIDGFGVILAGSTVHGSAIVREYVKSISDKKEATAFGPDKLMAPVSLAALANGASGHAMDYDDTQLSTTPDRTFGLLTHPTLSPLAASLALSERLGLSGAAFLEAFLIGFEVECKIAEAIDPSHYNRGFHSSGTIGTFGAAAAAAKLMHMPAGQVRHMLT